MTDVSSARKAKEHAKALIGAEPWCVGVGVEREDGVGFVVRVTVTAGSGATAREKLEGRLGAVVVKILEAD